MSYVPRALLAGGLGFAVSFLVACGAGAGLLTAGDSSNLNGQLDAVSSAVGAGQCGAASNAVIGLGNAVVNLPATIKPSLRSNLQQGVSTVGVLAAKDCHSTTSAPTTHPTTTTTTTTKSTSSSTTTPKSTTTTPSTSSSTTTTPSSSTTTPSSTSTPATSSTTPGTSTTSTTTGGVGVGGGGSAVAGTGNGNGGNGQ